VERLAHVFERGRAAAYLASKFTSKFRSDDAATGCYRIFADSEFRVLHCPLDGIDVVFVGWLLTDFQEGIQFSRLLNVHPRECGF
ncbi:MAG TPA: hypothetical protein VN766_18340, partial [Stellaceae bacterium]|nr:hypothetical protein [Stellaceae bacterium]